VFVVTVNFQINEEHLEMFMAAMIRQAQNSLTREKDCLQFDVCQDRENPERVFLYEIYSDRAAFDAHLETPHFFDFDRTVAPWTVSKVAEQWELVES
jgi:autoinducer 2-degrading protein